MSLALKILILCCGLLVVGIVIYLLVQRKINERQSLFWIFGSVIILILSVMPKSLDVFASFFHVDYPPVLLFLFAILILLVITLYQSIQISMLQSHLRELTQYIAVFKEACTTMAEEEEGNNGN